MRIVAGDAYIITASSGWNKTGSDLQAILKDTRTYNRVSGNGSLTFDLQRTYGIHSTSGTELFTGTTYSRDTTLINVSAGHVFELPDLPASNFTPAHFNNDVKYINNISGMGEYVGTVITRKGQTVSFSPMSFHCNAAREAELRQMLNVIRNRAFYVEYNTPTGLKTVYGWLEEEPKIEWTGSHDFIQVSFSMRVHTQ